MILNKLSRGFFLGSSYLGWDVRRTGTTLANLPRFAAHLVAYSRQRTAEDRFPIRAADLLPMLTDFGEQAGSAEGHYFLQDIWAARRIFRARPNRHLDVGSRIDGFVAHLLTFMDVDVVDVRPLDSPVKGLNFIQADGTSLAGIPDASLSSVSSLHALEHFGLGRYGDPVTPSGWRLGIAALSRVLAPHGKLYFSVPIGRERLRFNAHRIFSPLTILGAFQSLELVSFSVVDDAGQLREDTDPNDYLEAKGSCGLFEFQKGA